MPPREHSRIPTMTNAAQIFTNPCTLLQLMVVLLDSWNPAGFRFLLLSGGRTRSFIASHDPGTRTTPLMNPDLISLLRCPRCRGTLEVEGDPPRSLACRSCGGTYPIVGGDAAAGGRVVCRELRPAVEPVRRGAARGGRGDVPGQDRGRSAATWPAGWCSTPAAAAAGMPGCSAATGPGHRRRPERRRREGRRAVRRAARRRDRPGRPARPAGRRRRPSTWSIRSASCTIRPTRAGRSRRSPGGSSRADAWPSGSTAATRRPRSGSTPGSAPSRRDCRRRCSSPSAPAWARSAASRCSTAPSTSSPTSPTIPTGPCASATTSTGTPRDTSRTTPPTSCSAGSSRRASPTSSSCPRPRTAGSTTGPIDHNLIIGSGVNVAGRRISGQWSVSGVRRPGA